MSVVLSPRHDGAEELGGYSRFWNEERETRAPAAREALILERLQHQLHYAYENLPFYRRHYDEASFQPGDVRSLADFTEKVPIITKKMLVADQTAHPPFGSYLGVQRKDLARIHGSSGTSGVPTMYGVSQHDWQRSGEVSAMALWSAGVRPGDVVQISFPFSLFFGGWGLLQACEAVGACAFPVGTLASSEQQLRLMRQLRVDVLVATPSYVQHLSRCAADAGFDLGGHAPRVVIVAGEPGGSIDSTRRAMSEWLGGAAIIDLGAGSSSELYPFTANVGCLGAEGGVHLVQDENYTEVVSIDDPNLAVPPGTSGACVATHLWRESQPMIRFWTGDEAVLDDKPCPCGRTYPRLPRGVYGRLDDMLLIRGANVYPSSIDAILRQVEGVGTEYRIIVESKGSLDELSVEVERGVDLTSQEAQRALQHRLESRLKEALMIRTTVRLVEPGTFDVQMFKARRVIDSRRAS